MRTPPPADLRVSPECFKPCDEKPDPVTADPYSIDRALSQIAGLRMTCEERRASCAEAIERGRKAKVIR